MYKYCFLTIVSLSINILAFAEDLTLNSIQGRGYLESKTIALNSPTLSLCAYKRGDEEWDRKNQEWLDSTENTPYPDDLNDVEGNGYLNSRDCFPGDIIDDDDFY